MLESSITVADEFNDWPEYKTDPLNEFEKN
jgi:hypothetical protein